MKISLNLFYEIACLEKEGWGTAYEYWVKYQGLKKIAKSAHDDNHILVAGLPQKYGLSLDFLVFSSQNKFYCTVVDDRQEKIDELKKINIQLIKRGILRPDCVRFEISKGNYFLESFQHEVPFDVALSCESIQRFPSAQQLLILDKLLRVSKRSVLYLPNAQHRGHVLKSNLMTVRKEDIEQWEEKLPKLQILELRYIDFPPWPAGVKRKKSSNTMISNVAIGNALRIWAECAECCPAWIKRRHSHIIYVDIKSNYF